MSSSAHNLIEKNKLLKEEIWYKKLKLKNIKRKNRRLEEELFQTRFSITTLLRRFKPYPDVCDNINDGYQQVNDYLQQLELNNRELEELSSKLKDDLKKQQEENMNLNTVIKEKEEKLFGFENNSNNMDNNNNCDVIKNIQNEYKKLEDKFNQFSTTTSRRRLQQEEHLKQISDDYKPSVQTSQFQRALDESEERFQENTRKLNAAHEKNISDFQKAMKSIKPKVEALQNSVQSRADVLIREIKYLSNNLNSMELIEQCQQILPKKN